MQLRAIQRLRPRGDDSPGYSKLLPACCRRGPCTRWSAGIVTDAAGTCAAAARVQHGRRTGGAGVRRPKLLTLLQLRGWCVSQTAPLNSVCMLVGLTDTGASPPCRQRTKVACQALLLPFD
jgi:hypothetical protein